MAVSTKKLSDSVSNLFIFFLSSPSHEYFVDPSGTMVALETLPMHLTIFPAFWNDLIEQADDEPGAFLESGEPCKQSKTSASLFMDFLCNSCTNFHLYILNILTQERAFLALDVPFKFLTRLSSRVKKTSLTPQITPVLSQLSNELSQYDLTSQGLKDFTPLLSVSSPLSRCHV